MSSMSSGGKDMRDVADPLSMYSIAGCAPSHDPTRYPELSRWSHGLEGGPKLCVCAI